MEVVEQNIEYPFWEVLADRILCKVSGALGISIPFRSIARKLEKDGKPLYAIGDREVSIDDTAEPYQAFIFKKSMELGKSRADKYSCMGFSARGVFSLVIFGYLGCDQNDLWRILKVFEPGSFVSYETTVNTKKQTISGYIEKARVKDQLLDIAREYFPKQLPKLQKNQMNLQGLEIEFTLLSDDICRSCLTYNR